MRILDKASVCMGGEGFYIYFPIVPFFVLFLGQVIFLDSMAVCVFVVCMYVSVWLRCGVVWWGSSRSFSLDRRGDGGSMAGQQSRWRGVIAIMQLPTC